MCSADRDVVGDALEHGGIGGERAIDEGVHVVAGCLEPRDPRRVDQIGVQGEVELDVPGAGFDRVGHERAFDRDRCLDERVDAVVGALHAS